MKKRILSMLLAIVMVVGLIPSFTLTASAVDADTWDGTSVATAFAGGTGTEADPYQITTAAQLIYLRNQVNGGNSYDGMYFRLEADLDMASKTFGNSIGYINSGYKAYYFDGHFDGNNHTISNLTITSTSGYTALFGNVGNGTNESVISNLTLSGVNITRTATSYGAAALVGQAKKVKIENCIIESGTITSKGGYTAGFVATKASGGTLTITNCINRATIAYNGTGASAMTAGICAKAVSGQITRCVNYGNVSSTKGFTAGILADGINAVIEQCANYGDITNSGSYAAGILVSSKNYSIKNCFNQGDVSASDKAGGITYYLDTSKTDKIENCYNVGTVSITSTPGSNNYSDPITTTSSRQENKDRVINTYTLTDSGSGATTKTAYEFKSGAVATLLQGTQSETIWGQGTDYPEFYNGTNKIPDPPAAVTDITLSENNLTLNVGESSSLTATVAPDDAGNKNVSWSSSNSNVATVENGLVKAIAEGNAVITATTEDGGFTATCNVAVQTHAHIWNSYEAKCETCDSTHYTHTAYEWTNGVCSVCGVIGGYCGYVNQESSVEWMLTSVDSGTTYTLNISGTGNMGEYIDYNAGVDAPWFAYSSKITAVVINNGVKDIGWGAFKYLTNLTSVSIPDSVTEIKRAAFLGASSLTSLTLPSSINTIGQAAFKESGLTAISIPSGVTEIQGSTFSGCTKLTNVTLHNSITEIEGNAFQQCTALTSITIPDSVTSIGEYAFNQSGLTSVTIPASVTSLGMHAFSGCPNLKTVTTSGTDLTIAQRAFQGNEALETLTINNTGTVAIGDYAFMIETAEDDDENVDIGDVTIGGWVAWTDDDEQMESQNIDSNDNEDYSVQSETTGAAKDKLYTITLPANVTYSTDYATSFKNRVRSVSIGDTATVVVGNSIKGNPVFTPDTAFDKTITWASSDSQIASVDENGVVTGVSAGSATITATSKYQLNGVFRADTCIVTVSVHTHEWSYTLEGTNKIVATCRNSDGNCPNENKSGGSVTIAVPTSTEYTGNAIVARVDNQLTTGASVNVVYTAADGSALTEGKPVKNGTYTATITLGEGENKVEISVTYTITHDNHGFNYTDKEGTTHTATCACGFSETTVHDYTHDAANHKCICEKVEQFTITYTDGVDGEVVFVDVEISADFGAATPSFGTDPTRAGYTFNGWNPTVAEKVTGTQTYTAQWTEKASVSITETPQSYDWDGTAKTFNVVGTELTSFTVEYSVNGEWTTTAPSDAGEYDVKITRAEDDTYKAYSKEISNGLVINPAEITVEVTGIDGWTYGDAADTPAVVVKYKNSELISGYGAVTYTYYTDEECTVKTTTANSGASTEGGVPVNAGTYYVEASVAAAGNYKAAVSDAVSFTIVQKSISGLSVSAIADQTYTGEPLTPGFTVKDGETTLTKDVDYTVVYDKNTDAGEATITITGIGNYTGNKEVNFEILKAEWTTKTASDTAMYNTTGNELDLTSYIAPGGTVGAPAVNVENVLANVSLINGTLTYDVLANVTAESVTVTIPVNGATNHEVYDITVTINLSEKQSQTITVENAAEDKLTFTYGDTDAAISADSDIDGATISYDVTEGDCISVDASTGKITINKVGTAVITVTAAETDTYAETTKTITVEIKAKQITPPSADSTVFTYNGSEQTYGISATNDYTVSGNKQTNAGNYTVIVELTDKENTVWADTKDTTNKEFAFHIAKTKLTITAEDKEAYVGSRMPELTYTVEGLIDGDTISIELSCDANMNRVGETPIVVTATDNSGNYEITTVNGTLTVKNYPYIPQPTYDVKIADDITGGDVSASKKLAYKGNTITITVAPDAGYELTKLTVTDSRGNAVAITKVNDSKYTFKMPGYDVEIDAVFAKIDTTCPGDWTCPMYGYTDLDMTAWYHDGIHYCIEHGLMQGVGNNQFNPNGTTTRAMIVTILWRLEGSPVVSDAMAFEDVAADQWYTDAIRWAASEKIVEGYGSGKFGTNDAITREQMVTIMFRYAKYKGYDVSVGENTNILSYDDAFDVAEWAIPAMQWACGSGMIQGIADGSAMNLEPQGNATRAQAAAILQRYCENVADN